ncbi:phage baseplate assembly protein [Actinobacillus sp. GY-402]|nr:phage baseplate assembly protein [Actinobacillus sp. GY-402]
MRRLARQIQQVTQDFNKSIRQVFRGKLNLIKSEDEIQKAQVSGLADETLQDVELMQHFGFTSVPPENTEAVIIPIGGATSHGVIVATEHGAYRIKNLGKGETAIYNQSGAQIVLKRGKVIDINCDTLHINGQTVFNGDITQKSGGFTTEGDVKASGKSLINHVHQGDSGGTTSKPK